MAADVALSADSPQTQRTLALGPIAIALRSDDADAADWLAEFLAPWFAPTARSADWQVTLSSAAACASTASGW
ncbi:MAG: hypothetical protein ABI629_21285 [bacterium]